jgi:hypothetical protein
MLDLPRRPVFLTSSQHYEPSKLFCIYMSMVCLASVLWDLLYPTMSPLASYFFHTEASVFH